METGQILEMEERDYSGDDNDKGDYKSHLPVGI